MKRSVFLAGALACGAAAIAAALGDVSPKLATFVQSLQDAQTLSAKLQVSVVGGSTSDATVMLAKPNRVRIETATGYVIADGTTVTTYEAASNTYSQKPQTETSATELLTGDGLNIWRAFFDGAAMDGITASRDTGAKKLRGAMMDTVEVTVGANEKQTLYLDKGDNLPRVAEFVTKSGTSSSTRVMSVQELTTSPLEATMFAFVAPAGAKKVEVATHAAGVWLHDFDEAIKVAQATGKIVMVDFMASWCGPCKMMDAEVFKSEKFKSESKDFVLVKVDVDEMPAIAKRYGITAMPTVKFVRGDGQVVHEFVGYGGPDAVFAEMAAARSKK